MEEADALPKRIGGAITGQNVNRLSKLNGKTDSEDVWAAVHQLTGRTQESNTIDSISAESLNQHGAAVSTDLEYRSSLIKSSVSPSDQQYINRS